MYCLYILGSYIYCMLPSTNHVTAEAHSHVLVFLFVCNTDGTVCFVCFVFAASGTSTAFVANTFAAFGL